MPYPKQGTLMLRWSLLKNDYKDCYYYDSPNGVTDNVKESFSSGIPQAPSFSDLSYVRVNENRVRISIENNTQRGALYECNYCIIKNNPYKERDRNPMSYYCFINDIIYINDNCYELEIELDYMTTYYGFFSLKECFVERTHVLVSDDTIGNHIEPENVNLGDYVVNSKEKLGSSTNIDLDKMTVIAMTLPKESNLSKIDGLLQGAVFTAYNIETPEGRSNLNLLIQSVQENPNELIGLYCLPSAIINMSITSSQRLDAISGRRMNLSCDGINTDSKIDGYTPKNNKLLTYPYNYLEVSNNLGSSIVTRYEFFDNMAKPTFDCKSCISQPVTLILNPSQYKRTGYYELESLQLSNYPTLSWISNSYQNWIGQSALPSVMSAMTSALVGGTISVASGGSLAPVAIGALGNATNLLSQGYTASVKANNVRGTIGNISPLITSQTNHFTAYRMSITAQYAKRIDDYFTKYGYAVGKFMIPVLNARPEFTYIKTNGCEISFKNRGGYNYCISTKYMKKICDVFDNGVTFWKKRANIGNYSVSNR